MSRNADGEKQLSQYLLGEITEEEQQRLEEQLLLDDARVELLLIVEEELIDSYLAGKLSARERARFETYFLSTPARRRKLLAAKALRRYIATTTGTESEMPGTQNASWWQKLLAPPAWKLAAAAVLVIGLGLGVWSVFFSPSPVDKAIAALKKAYPERPIEARIAGFPHAPHGLTRSGSRTSVDEARRSFAAEILHGAVAEHPDAKSHHALGNLYLLDHKPERAIELFEEALKADPSNALLHNDLGAALMERGKSEQEKAESSGEASGESPKTFASANEHLTKALQIDGNLAEALFNQALCYEHLQINKSQAIEAWNKYLELDPSGPWAEEARTKLKDLEEQKRKTAWNPERFLKDFLSAYQSGEEESLWKALNLSRQRTGNYITERLLDDYLQFSAEGRPAEASRSLAMLVQTGGIEERKGGDLYTRDLVRYYQHTTPEQRSLLITARELFKKGRERNPVAKEEALDHYQRARQIFAQAGNEWEARLTDYLIGVIYTRLSPPERGMEAAQNVARYAQDHHYRWLLARSFYLLADLHSGANELSTAIDYSQRALEISKQLESPNDSVATLVQLATHYRTLGSPERSLICHQRSLDLAKRNPLDPLEQWPMYAGISRTLSGLDLLLTAIAYQKEALQLAIEVDRPLQMSRSYDFLCELYGKLNNYDEAVKQFENALKSGRSMSGDMGQNVVAHSLLRLGHIHRKAGNPAEALKCYDESVRLFERMQLARPSFDAHRGKLLAYLAQPDNQRAQEELLITERLLDQDRAKILEENLRNSFFDAGQDIYDLGIQLYAENLNFPEPAFEYSERSRARSLLDLIQAGAKAEGEHQTLEPELLPSDAPLPLSQIRQQMPDAVQIVQYAVLSEKLYIWVVSKSVFRNFSSAIRLKDLNSKVSAYLTSLLSTEEPKVKEADQLARELYDILIKPVEPFLDPNREVRFVPDEILNNLSFGALIEPASRQYLIQKYTISRAPSSTIFLRSTHLAKTKNQSAQEQCLILGRPLFDRDRFRLLDLPSTEKEAKQVARSYLHPRLLLAGDARESDLLREIQKADVIHLASHGLINEQMPEHSSIVLAKESSGGEPPADGLLEAGEVSRLSLRRAKLVVLSACRTGLGRNYRGEGMVGLARAFLAAGVPLVVASLWEVNDASTAELMASFHHYRTQGKLSTAQALRRAQLDMLQHPKTSDQRPFAWAAFVTVGGHAEY